MSRPSRGGGPRTMGASLLDQVLAETLDPAYAQAAQARAAREKAASLASAGVTPRERPRRWRRRAAVTLTLAVAGLLAAVTYDQAAAGAQGREQVRAALIVDIENASTLTDELAAQLEDLRSQVADAQEETLAASDLGQQALAAVAEAELASAAVPVSGPGLLVTLANAEPDADDDPVGGASAEDPLGRVRDGDLQLVVNALWAAGAEAVSINGQRLGPTTAIRFAGEAVLVDFRPVTNPYEVSAIGNPDTLRSLFLASPEVASLAVISESYGLRFEFAQEDELFLPAAGTPELRAAVPVPVPVPDEPPAPPPAEDGVPASDPTPGG